MRVEKAYKGNYHLLCEAEGKERKFVITNKKEEYALIDKVGIDNLTDKQLCSLVETFFVRKYNRKNEMCRVGKRNAMVLLENEM